MPPVTTTILQNKAIALIWVKASDVKASKAK